MVDVTDTGPLDWRIAITDGNGRPTNEFMRRWNTQRNNNGLITPVTVGNGVPSGTVPGDGSEYIDISTTPPTLYVASAGSWLKVGVYNFLDLGDAPHSYTGDANTLVQVNPTATGLRFEGISGVLDVLGPTQGDILYRDAAGWTTLSPGTIGQALTTGGAGANPTWSSAGSALEVQSNGTTLTTGATLINFTTNMTATASGTQVTVSSSGGGGGGGSNALWDLSAGVPSASSFTQLNFSTGTSFSEVAGVALIMRTATAVNNSLNTVYKAVPSSSPYRVAILVQMVYNGTNNWAFFGWMDSVSGRIQLLGNVIPDTTFIQNYTTPTSYAGGPLTFNTQEQGLIWVGLRDYGTNIYFEHSVDGVNFATIYTTSKASGYLGSSGYNNICWGLFDNQGGGNHPLLTVRVYDENGLSRSFPT